MAAEQPDRLAMKAMIFAAGLGTRLKPLTDHMPKALVPVRGIPLLAHQLNKLRDAGFEEVVVNVHHFADQIENYLATHDFGLRVFLSNEREELLDTGGGLRKALSLMGTDSPVLTHNVDILSNADLRKMADGYIGETVLLVSQRATQRYLLFDDEQRLVGWTNLQTGEVRSPYKRLDPARCRKWAYSGIQVVAPEMFPLMDTWPSRFSIIDFYLAVCDRIAIRALPFSGLRLLDVGKQDSLEAAEQFITGQKEN